MIMKIGNVEISNNVFLAPMAGVTDMAYRILCKKMGCGLTYTEMVSAKGMHYESKNTEDLLEMADIERPGAAQIFGNDPDIMAETAKKVEARGVDILDINMGCPTPKIVKNGDGSALMLKPNLIGEIVHKVSSAVKIPVTVKIRKGWDEQSINAVEVALIAEKAGAAAVAVHGRTREQFYSGCADWSIIKEVKQSLSIPVIGNGDIFTPQDARKMLQETNCDAVMIGRGAEGNPWIFKSTIEYLNTGTIISEPAIDEIIELIREHLNLVVKFKGENIGVKEMRKHIAWYLKGLPSSACIKAEIFKAIKVEEVEKLLGAYAMKIKQLE
jgi:nifR3 family TIM-barrel protein